MPTDRRGYFMKGHEKPKKDISKVWDRIERECRDENIDPYRPIKPQARSIKEKS